VVIPLAEVAADWIIGGLRVGEAADRLRAANPDVVVLDEHEI
jgi:hypothetical protein